MAASVTTLFVIGSFFLYSEEEIEADIGLQEEGEDKKKEEEILPIFWDELSWEYEQYPPTPKFQPEDSEYCQTHVKEFLVSAISSYERELKNTERLNTSF